MDSLVPDIASLLQLSLFSTRTANASARGYSGYQSSMQRAKVWSGSKPLVGQVVKEKKIAASLGVNEGLTRSKVYSALPTFARKNQIIKAGPAGPAISGK